MDMDWEPDKWQHAYEDGLTDEEITLDNRKTAGYLYAYICGMGDRMDLETQDRAERAAGATQTGRLRSDLGGFGKETKRRYRTWAFELGWKGCPFPADEDSELRREYESGVRLMRFADKGLG